MRVVILLAHGSPDGRHREDIEHLAGSVRRRSGWDVRAAYLDHHPPTAVQAAGGAPDILLVPAFVATGYHVREDLPAVVERLVEAGVSVRVTGVLGEDPQVPEGTLMARGVLWDRAVQEGRDPLLLSRCPLGVDLVLDRCATVID